LRVTTTAEHRSHHSSPEPTRLPTPQPQPPTPTPSKEPVHDHHPPVPKPTPQPHPPTPTPSKEPVRDHPPRVPDRTRHHGRGPRARHRTVRRSNAASRRELPPLRLGSWTPPAPGPCPHQARGRTGQCSAGRAGCLNCRRDSRRRRGGHRGQPRFYRTFPG